MATAIRKNSGAVPEVQVTPLEQTKKGEKVMPAPKDPIKNAEWRKRMSEIMKNLPEGVKQKRIASVVKALSGKPRTEEVKAKIGTPQKGKTRPGYIDHLSSETRRKLSDANLGRVRSEENRKRISDGHKGKPKSEETKRRISETKKGLPSTRKGAVLSSDTKLKLCELQLGGFWYGNIRYYDGPQYCEKWTHAFRERVRAAFDYTCQFPGCGYIWKEGDKRLAVHHINYRKDACCNPEVRPLFIPVCPGSCHAKTNNDRENWERHFTELIERDYDGKCFLTKEEMKFILF